MKTLLLVVASLQVCATYKILVYSPGMSNSHLMLNGRIADLLIKAGHDVVWIRCRSFIYIMNRFIAFAADLQTRTIGESHYEWIGYSQNVGCWRGREREVGQDRWKVWRRAF